MKKLNKLSSLLLLAGFAVLTALNSCQKQSNTAFNTDSGNSVALLTAGAIQVSAAGTTTVSVVTTSGVVTTPVSTSGIFVVNCYNPRDAKDSVTFASLPTAIGTYLTASYGGYAFQKAFKITNAATSVVTYIVVINFNGKPVGLKFDASGTFVAVLEQREGHDLAGPGFHEGGCFGGRGGAPHDTIAISALPTAIKTYFASNYPTDTLLHASVNFDASYIVLSENKGLFATAFTSGGTFIKRVQLYPRPQNHVSVAQTALPAAITTYLTITFPGYIFDKAYADKLNGVLQGYHVLINVNNTREVVEFDASGNFVKTIVIR